MTRNLFILATIIICLASTNTLAQRGKGKPKPSPSPTPASDVYIQAEFTPLGADGSLNRLTMDQGAPYQHNVDGVEARFFSGGSGDLVIRLVNSSRYVIFDFSEISDGTNLPAWLAANPIQWFRPGMNILEAYTAKENCAPDTSGVYNCDFVTRMNAGYLSVSGDPGTYSLLWNPETSNNRPVNSPEATSFVNVNYYKDTNDEIFTITPLPNCATRANNFTCSEGAVQRVIAGLERSKGRSVTGAGQYIMPFKLIVRPL